MIGDVKAGNAFACRKCFIYTGNIQTSFCKDDSSLLYWTWTKFRARTLSLVEVQHESGIDIAVAVARSSGSTARQEFRARNHNPSLQFLIMKLISDREILTMCEYRRHARNVCRANCRRRWQWLPFATAARRGNAMMDEQRVKCSQQWIPLATTAP